MAHGTGAGRPAGDRPNGYRVRIVYTEPDFQHRNPHSPPEFTGIIDVSGAVSYDDAVRRALAEWDYCVRHSGVGWKRVIKSLTVER